ncbi:DNA repair protein RadC domain protein [Candidatus Hepatincolaceae symbiont of Richtersius coronifer]
MQEQKNKVELYKGHRKRTKEKFINNYSKNFDLPDYELLEMLLFYTIPRQDVKGLAKSLISDFGSLADLINADLADLKNKGNISENTYVLLLLIRSACYTLVKNPILNKPILNSWNQLLDYCYVTLSYEKKELIKFFT